MTVAELIFTLQKFPPDMEVYVADWSEEYELPSLLEPEQVQVSTFTQRLPNFKLQQKTAVLLKDLNKVTVHEK